MEERHEDIKKQEEVINMEELSLKVFPELDAITAKRKASAAFKKACKLMKVDPEEYKPGKSYIIPKANLPLWKFILTNIDVLSGEESSKKKKRDFITGAIQAKQEVDKAFRDSGTESLGDSVFLQAMLGIYEMFYTKHEHNQVIGMAMFNTLIQNMQCDLDYILDNAPEDRKVLYCEEYCQVVERKVRESGEFFRNVIDRKLYDRSMKDENRKRNEA